MGRQYETTDEGECTRHSRAKGRKIQVQYKSLQPNVQTTPLLNNVLIRKRIVVVVIFLVGQVGSRSGLRARPRIRRQWRRYRGRRKRGLGRRPGRRCAFRRRGEAQAGDVGVLGPGRGGGLSSGQFFLALDSGHCSRKKKK